MTARAAIRRQGALQLLAPFLLLAALGFCLPAWIYAKRIGHTLQEAEHSRLRFTLNDLKADIEHGLAQGHALGDLANTLPALEAEARLDPTIDAIKVLDASGTVVHRAGPLADAPGAPTDSIALARDGKPAGTLAAWTSPRAQGTVMVRARAGLLMAALAATLFTATTALAVMAWLTRRRDEVLEAMAASLEHPQHTDDPRIAPLATAAREQAATTLVEIAAARHLAQQDDT